MAVDQLRAMIEELRKELFDLQAKSAADLHNRDSEIAR